MNSELPSPLRSCDAHVSAPARGLGCDRLARAIGRAAALTKGMGLSARDRGIVARRPQQQERFDAIVATFGRGYFDALDQRRLDDLARSLDRVERGLRGFAYEGAGMALAVRDALNPLRPRWVERFVGGPAADYTYLVHVGVGWTFGWVPGARRLFDTLDPLLRWLAFDGMGFRDAFFGGAERVGVLECRGAKHAYAARAYDQGVGRALWFLAAGDVDTLRSLLERFAPARRGDLWAGVGLAVVYAGMPDAEALEGLAGASGGRRRDLAQGAAFAAKALVRAGQLEERHEMACRILCRTSAIRAAEITDEAAEGLAFAGAAPAYEQWRRRIQEQFEVANDYVS